MKRAYSFRLQLETEAELRFLCDFFQKTQVQIIADAIRAYHLAAINKEKPLLQEKVNQNPANSPAIQQLYTQNSVQQQQIPQPAGYSPGLFPFQPRRQGDSVL